MDPSKGLGVEVSSIQVDDSYKLDLNPSHPDAIQSGPLKGMVRMPNVDLPVEMINMVTANRAYQANAAVLKRYQDMVNAALELLR
jgi:flagellar basal-body rod protein FlgC